MGRNFPKELTRLEKMIDKAATMKGKLTNQQYMDLMVAIKGLHEELRTEAVYFTKCDECGAPFTLCKNGLITHPKDCGGWWHADPWVKLGKAAEANGIKILEQHGYQKIYRQMKDCGYLN